MLAIDTLQRLLDMATEDGELSALRWRQARLRLSLYADDAAVFLRPRQEEVFKLMAILSKFGEATGLQINITKYYVQGLDLDNILNSFAGQRTSFPMTYLGLPLTTGRLRMVHLQPLQDKARAKMAGW